MNPSRITIHSNERKYSFNLDVEKLNKAKALMEQQAGQRLTSTIVVRQALNELIKKLENQQ